MASPEDEKIRGLLSSLAAMGGNVRLPSGAGGMLEDVLQEQPLPEWHPAMLLRALRDRIPQVEADDTSTMSGITSRLKRTGTALPRSALETMANWMEGTHNPDAVRVGPDTLAPLGLAGFGMGMAPKAAVASRAMADNARSSTPGTVVNAMGEARKPLDDFSIVPQNVGDYTVYSVLPKGQTKPSGDAIAEFMVGKSQRDPSGVEVSNAEIYNPAMRGRGIASSVYDRIEQDFAPSQLLPSPDHLLTEQGRSFWQKRDPSRLLKSDEAASTPGLAANATQQEDDGPALMELLRRLGMGAP